MNSVAPDLRGWLPVRIAWEAGRPVITWRPVGKARFTEPCFDDTLRQVALDPAIGSRRVRTPIEALRAVAEDSSRDSGPVPAGFVFHWSRCGSTLAGRVLAAVPDHLVLLEAPPIDAILRSHFQGPCTREWQIDHLRQLVGALARAVPARRRLFIKFDCWHTLSWPLIREAFPGVPAVFLYRDPVEVLVSHERQTGTQMMPGAIEPAWFGWELGAILRQPRPVFRARVLAALGRAALDAIGSGPFRLLNYLELRPADWGGLLRWFGIVPDEEARAAMREVARVSAKDPGSAFRPDARQKQREASPELLAAAREHAAPTYALLEAARKNGFGLAAPAS